MERCVTPTDSISNHSDSLPYAPSDSPGSSVSTRLKDEYDELLKYAVVVPTYDPNLMPQSLTDFRGSFTQTNQPAPFSNPLHTQRTQRHAEQQHRQHHHDSETDDSGTAQEEEEDGEEGGLPRPIFHQNTAPPRMCTPPLQATQRQSEDEEETRKKEFMPPPRVSTSPCSEVGSAVHGDVPPEAYVFSAMVDKDVVRMEGLMTTWLSDLKRNVLAEFEQSKIQMLERYKHLLHKEKERHAADMNRLQNETEGLKEMLLTYEQSIERKDEVISNLTHAMQKQCDKFEMAKTFCEWKIRHNDKKREAFATTLAERHYQRVLAQKVWSGWHSLVESKWKQRVERACQAKAQEVCMSLTNDYETRLASLNEALESTRNEVTRLNTERDRYEETMKKAFMRGVCALNLEAMTMFHGDEEGDAHPTTEAPDGGGIPMTNTGFAMTTGGIPMTTGGIPMTSGGFPVSTAGLPMTVPQEQVVVSEGHVPPSPRVITSTGATSSRSSLSQASSMRSINSVSSRTKPGQKGRVISAKISARSDASSTRSTASSTIPHGLNPPMSSVVVEKHQPITKATIGQATASQFPQSQQFNVQRRIAGQPRHLSAPNVQTIKMVE